MKNRSERGAAMVEFIFVVPFLVILLFTIIQFGLVVNRVQTFNAAAREGARVASLQDSTNGEIQSAVNNALTGMTLGITPAISTGASCTGRSGQSVTVQVTGPYTIQVPLVPDRNITLSGTGVFRCE